MPLIRLTRYDTDGDIWLDTFAIIAVWPQLNNRGAGVQLVTGVQWHVQEKAREVAELVRKLEGPESNFPSESDDEANGRPDTGTRVTDIAAYRNRRAKRDAKAKVPPDPPAPPKGA